jgi:osmoprotectant transport system substrate-binding protein
MKTYQYLSISAAALAAAGTLAACGSSKSSSGSGSSSTPSSTSTSSSAASGSLPGKGKPAVVIGDKNFAEEYILGDLYQQALKAKGYTVSIKANLGSTEIAYKALKSGQIGAYPEYDGTLLANAANDTNVYTSSAATVAATQAFASKNGLVFTTVTPFTDADALVTTKSYATQNGLKSIGDLKKLGSKVLLGGAPEFGTRSPDGLVGLEKYYGVKPTFKPSGIGSFYTELSKGEVNAAVGFTTDPPLATGKYTVLADPKGIFGYQNVGMVITKSVASKEGPAFIQTINQVSALLTQKAMIALDTAVEVDNENAATVAKKFLAANHL